MELFIYGKHKNTLFWREDKGKRKCLRDGLFSLGSHSCHLRYDFSLDFSVIFVYTWFVALMKNFFVKKSSILFALATTVDYTKTNCFLWVNEDEVHLDQTRKIRTSSSKMVGSDFYFMFIIYYSYVRRRLKQNLWKAGAAYSVCFWIRCETALQETTGD